MYAIIRKQSHKSGDLGKVQNHNFRSKLQENIDVDKIKFNQVLLGSNDLKQDINNYIENNNIVVRNKTTVIANEFVLTASPEFFFNNSDGTKKTREEYKKNLQNWINTQIKYLNKNSYGVCVNAVLHMDEATPHIHAMVLPIRDGKLNNKSFWRGKNSYSKLIDDYVKTIQQDFPNLRRGVSNDEREEKVTHTTIKQYRDDIATTKTQLTTLNNQKRDLKKLIQQAKEQGFKVGMNNFENNNVITKLNILNITKKRNFEDINKQILKLEKHKNYYKQRKDHYKQKNEKLEKEVKEFKQVVTNFYKPAYNKLNSMELENAELKKRNKLLEQSNNELKKELNAKEEMLNSIKKYFNKQWNDFINYFNKKNTVTNKYKF